MISTGNVVAPHPRVTYETTRPIKSPVVLFLQTNPALPELRLQIQLTDNKSFVMSVVDDYDYLSIVSSSFCESNCELFPRDSSKI